MLLCFKKWQKLSLIKIPTFTFCRLDEHFTVEPADVIIVEGILIFYDHKLRDLFDMKIFVDADSDDRLARRVQRDTKYRGRTLQQVFSNRILMPISLAYSSLFFRACCIIIVCLYLCNHCYFMPSKSLLAYILQFLGVKPVP